MKSKLLTKTVVVSLLVAVLFVIPTVLPLALTTASAIKCLPAGSTGLTATVVVRHSNNVISGRTINSTGCDIGIYVEPGVSFILIKDIIVTGANQHGIFVQDASHISITHNLVTGNGVNSHVCPPSGSPPPGCIPEDKPIEIVGTSNSSATFNVVSNNTADGGIGVADDGSQNPGAPLGVAGSVLKAANDIVVGNTIVDNTRGCGIVIAAYNQKAGIANVVVKENTIIGQAPGTPITSTSGPFIGQIVVATDGPFTTISDVQVVGNSLDGSFLPGIVLHANVFGDTISSTSIRYNVVAQNGYYPGPPNATSNTPGVIQGTTGISIVAENPQGTLPPAVITHTLVAFNTILGDTNGVWLCYTDHSLVKHNNGNSANPKITCAAGGS